jgi:signal transduction histidine kinase/ActR/RegA family two-component response regulator
MGGSSFPVAPDALARQLESCQTHFRNVIERNADGFLVVCPKGFIRFVNPAACSLLARPCHELVGELFGIPLVPGETTEIDLPLVDGKVRTAEMRVVETEWEGQPACLASLRDNTERRRLEEELREKAAQLTEANRRKDEFLAMLSHELRNPLAPICNSARVLALLQLQDPAAERHIAVIERQARHLSRLVDDLLDVVRLTRGKTILRREPIELCRQVIEPAVELAQPYIDGAGHRLEVSVPPQPLYVSGDATRLQQAVANLLNNAARYTPEGGRIWLTAQQQPGHVQIRVRDTGIGIASDLLPHIFDLFVQADHSLDRTNGGLGVGLTMVRSLVELHGGQVTADSAGPGEGSEFTLSLPALALAAPEEPGYCLPPQGRSPAAACLTVLVVDDNRDGAETIADLLRAWGHRPHTAHEGHTGVRLAAELRPDVLLLDLGLPGLDGYDVARIIGNAGLRDGLLLVAVTGYGQEGDRARTAAAGFDHHLVKPVDPEELRRLLEGVRAGASRPVTGTGGGASAGAARTAGRGQAAEPGAGM